MIRSPLRPMRARLEYALAWCVVNTIGALPRPLARAVGIAFGQTIYLLHGKLRRVGMRNLALAFPEKSVGERRKIVRQVFTSLGRQFAEVCLFPKYTRENVNRTVTYDGYENFDRASQRGKGVLFLTGHVGGWELSAFAHSLYGHPLHFVMRPLDNPYLDDLVRRYRTMHGNTPILKDNPARELLRAMKAGATVGILIDTNMTPPEGVFVDFFGIPACTVWDPVLRKYRLRFEPPVTLIRTGNNDADIVANTALFTKKIEDVVRR